MIATWRRIGDEKFGGASVIARVLPSPSSSTIWPIIVPSFETLFFVVLETQSSLDIPMHGSHSRNHNVVVVCLGTIGFFGLSPVSYPRQRLSYWFSCYHNETYAKKMAPVLFRYLHTLCCSDALCN